MYKRIVCTAHNQLRQAALLEQAPDMSRCFTEVRQHLEGSQYALSLRSCLKIALHKLTGIQRE